MPLSRSALVTAAVTLVAAGTVGAQATGAASRRTFAPPPLHWESLAFDQERGRLVLYGGMARIGAGFGYTGETLEWDGTTWRRAADSASGPPPRHAHAMAYDPGSRRVVLFGGMIASPAGEAMRCDTWTFDGARWELGAEGPCVTERPAAGSLVYEASARAMLLVDGPPQPPADTIVRPLRLWRWRDGAWALADSAGPRRSSPQQVAYDARRAVLVVPVFAGPDNGVWEWNGRSWRRVAPVAGPRPRDKYAAAYDARLERVVLVGGMTIGGQEDEWLADAWTWDGERWEPLPSRGTTPPGPRSHATLLHDARTGRLIYFGGSSREGLLRELWLYDQRGWRRWQP